MLATLLHRAYFIDGSERQHLDAALRSVRRDRVSNLTLARDLWKAMRTL